VTATQDAPRNADPRLFAREYLVVLVLWLALYGLSAAPGALWQDSGWAQVRTLLYDFHGDLGLALAHPLYYAFTTLFQFLPVGDSAYRTTLVSVAFGAVTVANLYLLLRLVTGRMFGAAIGATALAVAHTFWQHCAVAEVYTLTTALMSAELLCLQRFAETRRGGWLVALFALNGLGLSNHLVAILSLPVYGTLLLWAVFTSAVRWRVFLLSGVAWFAGAAIYLGMVIEELLRRSAGEVVNEALFGEVFEGYVLNTDVSASLLVKCVMYLGLNFPTPLAFAALVGLWKLGRPRGVFPTCFLALLAIHFLWACRYDVPDQYVFFLPSILFIAALIGLGAGEVARRWGTRARPFIVAAALLPAPVYAALPFIARPLKLLPEIGRKMPYRDNYDFFIHPWKTGYRGPEQFAEELVQALPDDSLLIADATAVRPVHYFQLTGQWNRRVEVWRPADAPNTTPPPTPETVAAFLSQGGVFVVSPVRAYCPDWILDAYAFEPFGSVYRVSGRRSDAGPATSQPEAR
jgi:hypothetical protein